MTIAVRGNRHECQKFVYHESHSWPAELYECEFNQIFASRASLYDATVRWDSRDLQYNSTLGVVQRPDFLFGGRARVHCIGHLIMFGHLISRKSWASPGFDDQPSWSEATTAGEDANSSKCGTALLVLEQVFGEIQIQLLIKGVENGTLCHGGSMWLHQKDQKSDFSGRSDPTMVTEGFLASMTV